ncbi:MAG TPA: group 1 truncated hemoglobin [Kofleriaceae bacterium]|nr:group 1 truncated hemoglobin [Kofleriaceae bacterium]
MRIRHLLVAALATVSLSSIAGCGGKKTGDTTAAKPADKSLYARLGGKDAITAVVDDFVANVVADDRINAFFKNADATNLKKQLVDQICEATGGPCKYTGKDMKTAHMGMGIKDEHFNALVEDLTKSLDKFKVGEKEKSELLGALGAMKPSIVQSPS